MKTIKKLLALTLVLCMVFCLSVAVFADGDETTPSDPTEVTYTDAKTVTITKKYTLVNEGTSPAETFTVEQVGDGTVKTGDATSAPALGEITGATFAAGGATSAGATQSITIALPEYEKVGIYEYTLKETIPTSPTAGVAYRAEEDYIKLVVTVIQQGEKVRVAAVHTEAAKADGTFDTSKGEGKTKTDVFDNTYSAGSLSVTKTVTGLLGDTKKPFSFTVKFTAPTGKTVRSTIKATVAGTEKTDFEFGKDYTFTLTDGQTALFENIPYEVTYEVTEADYKDDGYTTTKTGESGTINAATQTAAFTNDKGGTVDTGISLDSLPYILALAVAFGGAVVLFTRKRHVED